MSSIRRAIALCLLAILLWSSLRASLVARSADAPARPDETEFRADLNRGVWARGPDLPSPRQDAAAAVLGGRIYLIGGFGPHNQQMDTTLVWEPEIAQVEPQTQVQRAGVRLGAWTYAAAIPEPVDHAAAAALGGSIFVAGGRIENLVTNKFWRYDVANDVWYEAPSMPVARYGATMQAVGNKLYLIGGASAHGNDATSMEVYDTSMGRWSLQGYALPYEREDLKSAVLDDQFLVVVGGRDDEERNLGNCDAYDSLDRRWQTCSFLRQPRADFGLSIVSGRLVAVGGDDVRMDQPTQTMEISEPGIEGWLDGPWLPSPRHGMSQVTLGNVVWVIGGSSSSGVAPSSAVMRYVSPVVRVKFKGRG